MTRRYLTPNELMELTRPISCFWCEQAPALAGLGSNYCEKCIEKMHPRRKQPEAYEARMSDFMEGNGQSLEPSVRSAGGGISRSHLGARLDSDLPEDL